MIEVRSKYSYLTTILGPVFLFLFTWGIAGILTSIFLESLAPGGSPEWVLLIPIILLSAAGIFSIVYTYKKVIAFTIHSKGISLHYSSGTTEILWTQIKQILLTEKALQLGVGYEASIIRLKNGKELVFYAYYYRNMPQLRRTLALVKKHYRADSTIDLSGVSTTERKRNVITDFRRYNSFYGNHLSSLNGLSFYILTLFTTYQVISNGYHFSWTLVGVVIVFILFMWFLFLRQLYYFQFNDTYLVIRHHLGFHWYQAFHVEQIEEVVIEQPHRSSIALRVITVDYESRLFMAGSLRNKHWQNLMAACKQSGIRVRNEVI